MSGFQHFAIAGAGNIGKIVAEELLKKKDAGDISSVTVLTRSAGSRKDLEEKGAKIVAVDYSSPESLKAALSGVDVVVSSLPEAFDERGLAEAAESAGVKLIVPSDYANGPVDEANPQPLFQTRVQMRQKCKEIGLPYAVFWPGLFTDMMFSPAYSEMMGFNFAKGEITIPGSGTGPASWTSSPEIAQFIVHVLVNLPREKLEWRIFNIEGERASLNDIVESWKTYSSKPVMISHRPREEVEEEAKKNPTDVILSILLELDAGHLIVGDELSNHEFPQWKPKKVLDVLKELYDH